MFSRSVHHNITVIKMHHILGNLIFCIIGIVCQIFLYLNENVAKSSFLGHLNFHRFLEQQLQVFCRQHFYYSHLCLDFAKIFKGSGIPTAYISKFSHIWLNCSCHLSMNIRMTMNITCPQSLFFLHVTPLTYDRLPLCFHLEVN